MFSSVLIANRGEIACRIARTAKALGMRVIAVYSDADRDSLHVSLANEAYRIGPAPARESYLNGNRIIEVASASKAECVHPGYGFLSENAEFAESLMRAGLVFIGPPPAAIRAMGLKDNAKDVMARTGVPVVPGYRGADQRPAYLAQMARATGYPVMIKAIAGGGGKGMRRVENPAEFQTALDACSREAEEAFGNDRVLLEKFIDEPRHIEVQVLADAHGNCVHLFERDCSLQRRHQKVIEEAPAPGMSPDIRAQMGAAAVAGARAVGYVGAGTVEFIASAERGLSADAFYFMEMNTRLQVEHPVTEAITGHDLVALQFAIAAGERLPFTQEELGLSGHAIEARLYAEDPNSEFLPQSGRLHALKWPVGGVRIDTGVREGDEVTPYYDPMIAKLIAHGAHRDEAITRLASALDQTLVLGLRTNKSFLRAILSDPKFRAGDVSTAFIDRRLGQLGAAAPTDAEIGEAVAIWAERHTVFEKRDVWSALASWSLGGMARADIWSLAVDGEPLRCAITIADDSRSVTITRGGKSVTVTAPRRSERPHVFDAKSEALFVDFGPKQLDIRPQDLLGRSADEIGGSGVTRAPMSGKIVRVLVSEGEEVRRGDPLIILEAMKMEHALKAEIDGRVSSLAAREGAQVADRDVLCVIEEPRTGPSQP